MDSRRAAEAISEGLSHLARVLSDPSVEPAEALDALRGMRALQVVKEGRFYTNIVVTDEVLQWLDDPMTTLENAQPAAPLSARNQSLSRQVLGHFRVQAR